MQGGAEGEGEKWLPKSGQRDTALLVLKGGARDAGGLWKVVKARKWDSSKASRKVIHEGCVNK